MPFVTEEIWQNIKGYTTDSGDSIITSPYPSDLPRDYQSEGEMSYVMEAVVGIRNIRGEMNVSPALDVRVFIKVFTDVAAEVLKDNLSLLKRLAKASDIMIGKEIARPKGSATTVKESFEIYVPLEGLLNIPAEIDRLVKEKNKIVESLSLLDKKLLNEDFLKRAPVEIIEKERAKYQELVRRDERLEDSINRLKEAGVGND
jgi:valyl-tRNA synthetase